MMRRLLNNLFNWKDNPASVFYTAGPIALLAFGLHALYAGLMWYRYGDYGYTLILIAAVILLIIGLIPAYRMHKTTNYLRNRVRNYGH